MFEVIRSNKRVAQVILAILILPFAFFGMDAYFSDTGSSNEVARVGSSVISAYDFDEALRTQQDRLRNEANGQVDRAVLESAELREAVLDNLVNQRLLALFAAENRLFVTSQQLQDMIAAVPAFQEEGKFSLQRYETMVRAQGMTPAVFEGRLAQDIRVQQLVMAVADASFVAQPSARRFLDAQLETRKLRELRFSATRLAAAAELKDEEVAAYYDANAQRFERPARLQAEYVVFDRAAVEARVAISDEQVKAFYDGNAARFGVAEERQARHILLALEPTASQEAVDKAMAEARAIAAELRANRARFAAIARAKSQDPGSAERGGDLGFFGRGAMVGAFEDAVFSAAKGEVGEPVRTEFGVHVIEVTDIKPASVKPFAAVRAEILAELRGQEAGRRFAELAEQFANIVYEQPDSLAPAAESLGLEIRVSDWLTRQAPATGALGNERLLNALFSEEVSRKGRNTEAIETANGTLVAARVKTFEAAQRLALDEVRGRIAADLRLERGVRAAAEQGEQALAALQKGDPVSAQWSAQWSEQRAIQRAAPALPAAAMRAVFTAPVTALPAYVGVGLPGSDYVIYRIDAVEREPLADKDPRVAAVAAQYGRLLAGQDFTAFLAALRQRYEVKLNPKALQRQ